MVAVVVHLVVVDGEEVAVVVGVKAWSNPQKDKQGRERDKGKLRYCDAGARGYQKN